jgi:hypothetical protein
MAAAAALNRGTEYRYGLDVSVPIECCSPDLFGRPSPRTSLKSADSDFEKTSDSDSACLFVCLFTHLCCKEVNISQKKSEISNFSFLKSYYSLYKPHAQISTIVKTS